MAYPHTLRFNYAPFQDPQSLQAIAAANVPPLAKPAFFHIRRPFWQSRDTGPTNLPSHACSVEFSPFSSHQGDMRYFLPHALNQLQESDADNRFRPLIRAKFAPPFPKIRILGSRGSNFRPDLFQKADQPPRKDKEPATLRYKKSGRELGQEMRKTTTRYGHSPDLPHNFMCALPTFPMKETFLQEIPACCRSGSCPFDVLLK